jgi:nucleotide-binding universal stress UspA family protein
MEKLTSVLIVVDRIEAAETLITKGVMLARQFGARVTVLLRETAHARTVAQICSRADPEPISLVVDRHAQKPLADIIADVVRETAADLVIKAPLAAHPLGRALLHATDRRVAVACPVSLMLAHARAGGLPQKFVAAVDVADPSRSALARAVVHTAGFLAMGVRGALDVVYSERETLDEHVRLERAVRLARLVREFHIGGERLRHLTGPPEDTMVAFGARGDYDVLVLGALTHRTGLPTMFASLTSQLVDAFDCDVVLVKEQCESAGEQRLDEAK